MTELLALSSAGALLSVWIGYPLVIAALAALRRPRVYTRAGELPSVTIVLATRDSGAAVRARIENCLDTAYPSEKLDVIVVVDALAPMVPASALAGMASEITILQGDAPGGKAAALNAAMRGARGDVVVFTDTHQRFDRSTIPNLVAGLADPRVGAVSGRFDLGPGARPLLRAYWELERRLRRFEAQLHSCVGVTGAVYAIRKSLWTPVPAGLILDDVFIPMQLVLRGHRIGFADNAHAVETRQIRGAHEYARKVRTLTGNVQLCAWLPAILVPGRNPIWAQFVFHKLLRLLTPYWVLIIAAWLLFTGAGLMRPYALPVMMIGIPTALWLAFSSTRAGKACRRIAFDGVLLQAAVVMAGINGLRGRWQVWE